MRDEQKRAGIVGEHALEGEVRAATTGEDAITIEDVYEPYLLKTGFLVRTPRGRMATRRAYEHLGYDMPEGEG